MKAEFKCTADAVKVYTQYELVFIHSKFDTSVKDAAILLHSKNMAV